eukprot:CAMPEP_0115385816 /NCGR_PEP_ID=MMETSP0271-20121206/7823_1 /TAXON_ID=71861 /ORGANISM="Scrippsiella trochoidea, Strain CCMP3099" /LENGTH=85 /DNA_ID=CAMNT_0002809223 /DNA_START=631 /DNA_END=885 /DNA_ORIENTATION=-
MSARLTSTDLMSRSIRLSLTRLLRADGGRDGRADLGSMPESLRSSEYHKADCELHCGACCCCLGCCWASAIMWSNCEDNSAKREL